MAAGLLTEGDADRGAPPDLDRLRVVAQLAPHLPETDPMWPVVLDWAAGHGEEAPEVFGVFRARARGLRDAGELTDADTLTSWAYRAARAAVGKGETADTVRTRQ